MAARIAALAAPAESAAPGEWAPEVILPPQCAADDVLTAGPAWALVGCVVSPGFEYEDFEAGEREALLACYPQAAGHIRGLS